MEYKNLTVVIFGHIFLNLKPKEALFLQSILCCFPSFKVLFLRYRLLFFFYIQCFVFKFNALFLNSRLCFYIQGFVAL